MEVDEGARAQDGSLSPFTDFQRMWPRGVLSGRLKSMAMLSAASGASAPFSSSGTRRGLKV